MVRLYSGVWRGFGVWQCRCQRVHAYRRVHPRHKGEAMIKMSMVTLMTMMTLMMTMKLRCQSLTKLWSSAMINNGNTFSSKAQRWPNDQLARFPHWPESGLGNLANAHHAHDDDHKHNGLWSQIMQGKAQTGSYMKAIVIRTGFMTTKVCLFLAYAYLSFDRHDNNCVWWSSWQ